MIPEQPLDIQHLNEEAKQNLLGVFSVLMRVDKRLKEQARNANPGEHAGHGELLRQTMTRNVSR